MDETTFVKVVSSIFYLILLSLRVKIILVKNFYG